MKLAVALLGLLLLAGPADSANPSAFASLAFRQHPGALLPLNAQLVDATGQPQTLGKALAERPGVLVLEYLRCKNLCGLVLTGAVRAIVAAGLMPGRDIDLIAISIDPRDTARDAAAAQAIYSLRLRAPAGARFFTAAPGQVRAIASAEGFPYRYDRRSDQFLHPAGFVVTTPDGRISRYMLGLSPKPAQLRQAVAEAALEKVSPPAHPILCLCFGYDPDEGSVAALTWQLVRIVSLMIVLACAALIGFLSLRRRSA
ncbi:MAG TPA: SCO family protein [Sphingomicrobium sp.]|jgi:protein SCO1/2|nr:SCO family protein [Sphingomicrobium sp.]